MSYENNQVPERRCFAAIQQVCDFIHSGRRTRRMPNVMEHTDAPDRWWATEPMRSALREEKESVSKIYQWRAETSRETIRRANGVKRSRCTETWVYCL